MALGLGGKDREDRGKDGTGHGRVLGIRLWTETAISTTEVDLRSSDVGNSGRDRRR